MGKFIVIDGTDGSGKATQTALLAERLKGAGFEVEIADFPQYGAKSAGAVEEYLNGKYGSAEAVGPYRASIFYAVDRYAASFKIKRWLEAGIVVLANRYVTANMAHQGGKISNALERKNFFAWLNKLEYGLFGIPKPDLNLILHVDAALAQKLVDRKAARDYLGGKARDIHEADLEHLRRAEKVYLEIAAADPALILIECIRDGALLTVEEISDLVWRAVAPLVGRGPAAVSRYQATTDEAAAARPTLKTMRFTGTAKLPAESDDGDGYDLFADDDYTLLPGEKITARTGLALILPRGFIGLVISNRRLARIGLRALTSVLDSRDESEVKIDLVNRGHSLLHLVRGQKIARLIIEKVEKLNIEEV